MAAGVLPLCNNHSGLADVLDLINTEFPELVAVGRVEKKEFFGKLPQLIFDILDFHSKYANTEMGIMGLKKKVRQVSVDNFSWEKIASKLI